MGKGPWPKQSYDHIVKRYFSLHKCWPKCSLKLCGCECGKYVRSENAIYLLNHHCKGKPAHNVGQKMSDNQKRKLSKTMKANYKKGLVPWNKNKKGFYSFTQTDEAIINMVASRKANGKPWHSEETRNKIGIKGAGKFISDDVKKRTSDTMKAKFHDKKFCREWKKSHSILPNKLELKVETLLSKLFGSDYKYVGDFDTFIGGKCPDFINVNGQKKIIEVFGDYWHDGDDPNDRISHFAKYGFKTLVLWESDIHNSPTFVKEQLMSFHHQ